MPEDTYKLLKPRTRSEAPTGPVGRDSSVIEEPQGTLLWLKCSSTSWMWRSQPLSRELHPSLTVSYEVGANVVPFLERSASEQQGRHALCKELSNNLTCETQVLSFSASLVLTAPKSSGCCSLTQAGASSVAWWPLVSRFPLEVLG